MTDMETMNPVNSYKLRPLFYLALALVPVLFSRCLLTLLPGSYPPPELMRVSEISRDTRQFLLMQDRQEQIRLFREKSFEEQYRLICLDQSYHHHRNWSLVETFAERGWEAVPFLKERLAQTLDAREKRTIVTILCDMTLVHRLDLRSDAALMKQLEDTVESLRGELWYESIADSAARVRRGPSVQ